MKRLIPSLAVAFSATLAPLLAGGEGWTTDFEAAKKQAAEEKKSLLIDFTGSDWCGWCIKLVDEVFKHDAFKTGVKDKFVLVEIDFPQDKSKQSEELQKQNEELQEKYAIQGFPTILLTDADGMPFAKTGYQQGGPEAYVEHLDELLGARKVRDEAFAEAAKLEGAAKAKALVAALKAMDLEDELVASMYGDVVDQIKAADPDDESGFVRDMEMKEKFATFQSELMKFGSKEDHEGALKHVDQTLESGDFEGELKQQIAFYRAMILAQMERFDDAIKALDEAKAVLPDAEMAGRMDQIREQLVQARDAAAAETEEDASEEAEGDAVEAPAEG